ncbi:STAS/SEC14 domain-containing protein [Archangium violaceum]|uniref:STAS/SEC14 domain-containing protein n=1 Tax=Archangium violaceum TaxID=83451 RepID=UPI002B30EA0F|nr:STAS/SEC14 domain-containing protein [Archangium violaceum]
MGTRAAPYFSFDDSHWPLLINRLVGDALSQEFEEFLAQAARSLSRNQPHVLLMDLSKAGGLSTHQRQRLAEWLQHHEERVERTLLGIAYVTQSPLIQLAMNVVLYMRRPAYPYILVSREDEALTWAVHRLEDAGMHASAARIRRDLGLVSEYHRTS